LTTCSFHVSLLFNLSVKLLSELMILSSALMNSRFVADFDLCERENFHFSFFDLQCSHLWSYWVEWELVLLVRLCFITCNSIWYIICFNRLLSSIAILDSFMYYFELCWIWWTCISETLSFLQLCSESWFRIDFWSILLHHNTNFAFALSLFMHHQFCIFFKFAFLMTVLFTFRWALRFIRISILRIFAV